MGQQLVAIHAHRKFTLIQGGCARPHPPVRSSSEPWVKPGATMSPFCHALDFVLPSQQLSPVLIRKLLVRSTFTPVRSALAHTLLRGRCEAITVVGIQQSHPTHAQVQAQLYISIRQSIGAILQLPGRKLMLSKAQASNLWLSVFTEACGCSSCNCCQATT
jgi:hypothetical protein